MTILEHTVREIILWLSIISVNPPSDQQIIENFPRTYILPQHVMSEAVAGCPTQVAGLYLGGENHIIVLAGLEDANGDVLMVISPMHKSNMVHELKHYFQDLNDTEMGLEEREREAYMIENEWRNTNGVPPLNVEEMVEFSVNGAEGKDVCLDGSEPKPFVGLDEVREELKTIIFKYPQNRKLREIYESRDINTTHGQEQMEDNTD